MGVNLSEATPDKYRHTRFGKNYFDIDFYGSDSLQEEQWRDTDNKAVRPVVGELKIGRTRIPVTLKELERLHETILEAKSSLEMSYRLGLMNSKHD